LRHEVSDDLLQINGDATQLHQLLLNLVNNARDALSDIDEKPCINIKLNMITLDNSNIGKYSDFKAGRYAHLSVEDNGCGIPENQIEHLFEPFYTTKSEGKGTGLGLAMVFGSVKIHQGYIEVESVKGAGSTFHVYLPLQEHDDLSSLPAQPKLAIEKGDGELVLLVDDQEDILKTSEDVLDSLGYRTLRASNGLEAIDTFIDNQNDISLIIIDIVMPELGGVEAVEKIREINPDIKVIFSTGYDKDESLSKTLLLDKAILLAKPYSISELAKSIRTQLDS